MREWALEEERGKGILDMTNNAVCYAHAGLDGCPAPMDQMGRMNHDQNASHPTRSNVSMRSRSKEADNPFGKSNPTVILLVTTRNRSNIFFAEETFKFRNIEKASIERTQVPQKGAGHAIDE